MAGLPLQSDETAAFTCRIGSPGVADDLLRSLYLPDVRLERMQAGRRVVRHWVGSSIAMPLRRIVSRLPD